jgi:hypothetical protein
MSRLSSLLLIRPIYYVACPSRGGEQTQLRHFVLYLFRFGNFAAPYGACRPRRKAACLFWLVTSLFRGENSQIAEIIIPVSGCREFLPKPLCLRRNFDVQSAQGKQKGANSLFFPCISGILNLRLVIGGLLGSPFNPRKRCLSVSLRHENILKTGWCLPPRNLDRPDCGATAVRGTTMEGIHDNVHHAQ